MLDYGIELPVVDELDYPTRKIKQTITYNPSPNIVTGDGGTFFTKTRGVMSSGATPTSRSKLFTSSSPVTSTKSNSKTKSLKLVGATIFDQKADTSPANDQIVSRESSIQKMKDEFGPKVDWVKQWERYYAGQTDSSDKLGYGDVQKIVNKAPANSPSLSADIAATTITSQGVIIEEDDKEVISIASTAGAIVIDKVASTVETMPKKIDYIKIWENIYENENLEHVSGKNVSTSSKLASSESVSTSEAPSAVNEITVSTDAQVVLKAVSQEVHDESSPAVISSDVTSDDAATGDLSVAFSAASVTTATTEVAHTGVDASNTQEALDDINAPVVSLAAEASLLTEELETTEQALSTSTTVAADAVDEAASGTLDHVNQEVITEAPKDAVISSSTPIAMYESLVSNEPTSSKLASSESVSTSEAPSAVNEITVSTDAQVVLKAVSQEVHDESSPAVISSDVTSDDAATGDLSVAFSAASVTTATTEVAHTGVDASNTQEALDDINAPVVSLAAEASLLTEELETTEQALSTSTTVAADAVDEAASGTLDHVNQEVITEAPKDAVISSSTPIAMYESLVSDVRDVVIRIFNQIFGEGGDKRHAASVLGAVVSAGAMFQFSTSNPLRSLSAPFTRGTMQPQQQEHREEPPTSMSVLNSMKIMKPASDLNEEESKRLALVRSSVLREESEVDTSAPPIINPVSIHGSQTHPAPVTKQKTLLSKNAIQAPSSNVRNDNDVMKSIPSGEKKIIVYKKPLGESPVTFGYVDKSIASPSDSGVNMKVAAGVTAVGVASTAIGSIENVPKVPSFPIPTHLRDFMDELKNAKRLEQSGPSSDGPQSAQPLEKTKGRFHKMLDQFRYNVAYGIESHMPDVILAVLFWDVGFLVFGFVNKLLER